MKKFVKSITLVASFCLLLSSANIVSASATEAKSAQTSIQSTATVNFFQNILNNGTLSADKQLITYDEAVYVYSDIVRHANAESEVPEDDRSPSAGYYISNDISYEYTDISNPVDTLDATPGQSFSFSAGNSFAATATATATLKASEVLQIGVSNGYTQTYTLTKTISDKNNTNQTKRYGLCKIYRVHTFDIYYKNIFGSNSFITAAVFYEPVSMVVRALN
ncbi:hypothetical protein MKX70_27925 [Paenibacillus sp. FSL R7-0312]|uniref:hypothetical protein n=1 Tax=unclassified Paenibacillus TaxID=185978 RepID=UPI0004F80D4E|nr:hypothetical protein [Paenibacillus sp. FSL R5-0912]AIQ40648.1 hypothetical protein R50912_11920 [Paenibacillus sp. FSL R5-0912]